MCTSLQIVGEWSDVRTGVPDGMSINYSREYIKMEYCTMIRAQICAKRIFTRIGNRCYNKHYNVREEKSMAKTSAAQQRAVHKYVKNNYDRLELSVPKGEKAAIQQAAKQAGQSANAYIYEAVCARMQQENAMLDTPGVVKNLVRDTDPVE